MNAKEMTDAALNRALAERMGYTLGRKVDYGFKPEYDMDVIALPNDRFMFIPDYCTNEKDASEVQAAAIAKDADGYVSHVAKSQGWTAGTIINRAGAARIASATPRQRAEAAYGVLCPGSASATLG